MTEGGGTRVPRAIGVARRVERPGRDGAAMPRSCICSGMAKHDVALNISQPIPVGSADIEIVVRQDDKAFGRVKISRGSIDWLPAHKQKAHWMDWNQFSRLMSEQGNPE